MLLLIDILQKQDDVCVGKFIVPMPVSQQSTPTNYRSIDFDMY